MLFVSKTLCDSNLLTAYIKRLKYYEFTSSYLTFQKDDIRLGYENIKWVSGIVNDS